MHSPLKQSQSLSLFSDKLFYKIGEVSKMLEVESYVLRYWESEFSFLSPKRSGSGQRMYTKQDIDLLLEIKKLLYDEKYTIDGVRKRLQRNDIASAETSVGNKIPSESLCVSSQGTETEMSDNVLNYVKKRLREIVKEL